MPSCQHVLAAAGWLRHYPPRAVYAHRMERKLSQVTDKEVRVGKDGVAVTHSPQQADEWQQAVGELVAEFSTKQVWHPPLSYVSAGYHKPGHAEGGMR